MKTNPGELKNLTYTSDLHTIFTIQSIESLQSEISGKLVKWINRYYSSKRNDLGLCINGEKSYQKLCVYMDVLENIKYCSSCYHDFKPSEVILAIKKNLNNLF